MAWYVFALVDAPPRRGGLKGFSSPLTFQRLPGCFAAAERREDVPVIEMDALQRHDRTVSAIWTRVPAILPVRFGTLMDIDELRESLDNREDEFREAFDLVRAGAQFTWRRHATARPRTPPAAPPPASGAEYLRRAALRSAAVPARYAAIRTAVGPFVRRERFEPAAAPRPERLYHLVARRDARAYQAAGRAAAATLPLALTGPWPPYAFAPGIL